MPRPQLTTAQRRLAGTVAAGAVLIAAIGFAGSYTAVRQLAEQKRFGDFAMAFPVGIDIGIVVLLALDLLLAWLRMPYPLLRHTAWLLTAATIAFNGAAAWPDPVGTAMHAVIPVLFVVVVEAARNAVGRIADITADKHMDGVRLTRWLLSPIPTFRLWRRMKLWELRSYDQVIRLEQQRLAYRARLRADHGWLWRWNAPVEDRLQLRLARYGRPLPATEAVPAAAPVQPPEAEADFDETEAVAVALALALAAAALALPAAPPPPNAVPTGARLLPVVCRQSVRPQLTEPAPAAAQPAAAAPAAVDPERWTEQVLAWAPPPSLVLDLAPMQPPLPEVTATAQPQPIRPASVRPSDEALIERAVKLAATGRLSGRRLQRELGIGQRRAPRILAAAEARIRAAAADTAQPLATASAAASGAHP
ncbi:DUF2637 domain-containing protein [Streptomyces sp. NBC_01237]|uniref:DUF2637 domain-containing protein n=1 Tax=Streptomyces sp. NBC_01237 TaxID=2903790 RepID=UPI002DD980BC|nr:DUF2637 domain-containing protein [Streptomyces sp. NBC_01237]WRZ72867.1 DUF2637 domain-containing protein [Streptomyces sp. NBC_01237]